MIPYPGVTDLPFTDDVSIPVLHMPNTTLPGGNRVSNPLNCGTMKVTALTSLAFSINVGDTPLTGTTYMGYTLAARWWSPPVGNADGGVLTTYVTSGRAILPGGTQGTTLLQV